MREDFLGVPIDLIDLEETAGRAEEAMRSHCRLQHVALNVAKFVHMQANNELRDDVLSSDIIGVDGMGIVAGARLFGIKVPERVAGVDLMERLIELCAAKGYQPYFLGAKEDVLAAAIHNLSRRFPKLKIAGFQHGYYPGSAEAEVVEAIRQSRADCLFIGMPTPRKERFLAAYKPVLDIPFIMGVGGGIDILAGLTKRAPNWMQAAGLEWLYRIIQEPRRMWKRYLTTNVAFAVILVREFLKSPHRKGMKRTLQPLSTVRPK
ncbi:MAG TPA: WecB/TagA/CpsF family glycosyltransferase [Methylocella sp.]|nr:WecB/TagA/CpsF family glycosyltransferase [Methylocella sp.]